MSTCIVLPFGFFTFPWSASKARLCWFPRFELNRDLIGVAWLGFEIGRFFAKESANE